MREISTKHLIGLLGVDEQPCVSLYQPTHRTYPENQQDVIRFRNLVLQAETLLRERYPKRQFRTLLEQFESLARDAHFWTQRKDSLAILGSSARFEVYELQRPVPERVIVADSFHVKPMLRILQSADRYHILCLNRDEARLYEGNRDVLDRVELTEFPATAEALGKETPEAKPLPSSYSVGGGRGGGAVHYGFATPRDKADHDMYRFFREVDRGILEFHSRPSGLPLILAALPEHHEPFRSISRNPYLIEEGITVNPLGLGTDELRREAWACMLPRYLSRLGRLTEDFHAARARHAGSADLSDVARQAVAGNVATLLVEADRVLPGTIDRSVGSIHPADSAAGPTDDMLDDLSEIVLAKGGEVVVVPAERMPTDSGLAAIYRYQ